jgi:two-component system sensor histidine kinase UhpB
LETERGTSSARALAAQEDERRRIAQELHDEVGQSLTAVVLTLTRAEEGAPSAALREEIRSARETARSSLDEVRRVARRLRPGLLDDLGLLASLSALASDHAKVTGAIVDRRFDPALPKLPDEVELVVFRIAQEALTNVARHADAQHVSVSLHRYGDRLRLSIGDDGVGIGNAAEGAGLRGMRERSLLVHGQLELGGDRRNGTTVRLDVPIAQD